MQISPREVSYTWSVNSEERTGFLYFLKITQFSRTSSVEIQSGWERT